MQKLRAATLAILLVLGSLCVCLPAERPPRNIILFIGDGMGVAQVTAGKTVKGTLHLEEFSVVGLMTTHAADEYVTDSAAGATALAAGIKTYNKAIGVDVNKQPVKTVLEYAAEKGKATGLVVTSTITHATPAAFAAHVDDRGKNNEIAEQLAQARIDVMLGGGWGSFTPKSQIGGQRDDQRDWWAAMAKDRVAIRTPAEFQKLATPARLVGLFDPGHLPAAAKREVSLPAMTRKAIDILSQNRKGFFLMVEGSQIDWSGHDNDSDGIIAEMIDFDDAVGVGLEFAKNNHETLIVVTADHETGGYSLLDGSVDGKKISRTAFTTKGHTGVMVPIFAFGPGSAVFGGIRDNTFVGRKLIEYVTQ
ncbi:MAG: alkaline phosphatase [candidate division KSB1 bacterium]|nr:alkaline phosphatase [candidate division KSB1 bacterium]MDZ7274445.1 alkaline phosphatase [candidate division KSB1 bacterium]MDZ7284893.1 alkaline phosphatase [candidate division KSB1 bacterium]MDZ7297686.1 alkaline phosphatase [candidate division KSB1 bacterium]MDZ7305890.1 alkaline phosphatase [candidate division KSB1 bacterium]